MDSGTPRVRSLNRIGRRARSKGRSRRRPFDPYELYAEAVQGPDEEMRLLGKWYRELTGRDARSLREDFCGTFANSIAWATSRPGRVAYGVDLDPEPIQYGREHYLSAAKPSVRDRVHITQGDVLHPQRLPKVDIVCALNFSFNVLKRREDLIEYFRGVRRGLKPGGVWIGDVYGGIDTIRPHETKTAFSTFTYFWELSSFNPINHHAVYYIHFKRRGEKKRRKVFSYDWRMWSIPEIREALGAAGLSSTQVIWEGTSKDGSGNGRYRFTEAGEPCDSWVAYVVARRPRKG